MKAIILAGGEGARLRPLTCDIPKPMARLCGRPILEYILELLELHGFREATLTLRYLPDSVTNHFPSGAYRDVALSFLEEDKPLGTAGGVKNACLPGDDEVLVISGDAMCDFDLAALVRYHRENGADVTIAAKRVADPREYGLIVADGGNVAAFLEKPAFSQAVSDLANTGIYVLSRRALDLIPPDTSYDFAKNLFPLALENGMKLLCWESGDYWCDIGDLGSYVACQRDMLEGRVRCAIHGRRDSSGNVFAGDIPHGLRITGAPVYIGRDVTVEENAVIEDCAVIDDGCHIGRGARISGSVVLPNVLIGPRARLTGALVCGGAAIKTGAQLFEGAVVGAGAVVGEKSTIHAGVKIWNKKVVPPSVIVAEHVKTGQAVTGFFDEDGITGQVGVELTPEFLSRLGAAVGSLNPKARVAVGCDNSRSAEVLADALVAGIRSTGCGVMDFGRGFQAQFAFSMNFCSLSLGVFVRADTRAGVRVLTAGGLPANREIERSIEAILSRGEFVRCPWDAMGERVRMDGMSALYRSQLLRYAPRGLIGCSARVRCRNLALQQVMRDTLFQLGCDTSAGYTFEFSSQGDKVRVFDPSLGYIPHHRLFALCALSELENGSEIAVPFDSPQMLDEYAFKHGGSVLRYFNCPADLSDLEARSLAKQQMWPIDALMQSVMLLDIDLRCGGLSAALEKYPAFDRETRTVETNGNPAALIRAMHTQKTNRITEGVLWHSERGVALLRPLKRGTGIRIIAEAASGEIAAELCGDLEQRLKMSGRNHIPFS